MDGQAVQARAGDRHSYRPLDTPLCHSSNPVAVVEAYLSLHPFRQIYVADLDAIRGFSPDEKSIHALHSAFPDLQFWIDGGFRDRARLSRLTLPGTRPVIGSETLTDTGLPAVTPASLLSLDFQQDRFLGPASLLTDKKLWPRDVIVMSMSRIGCDTGPDWKRLHLLQQGSLQSQLYAAGGVRNLDDLQQLSMANISGALTATALHNGAISATQLRTIIQVPGLPGT